MRSEWGRVLTCSKSKANPKAGDVFFIRIPGKGLVVGLVVKTDACSEVIHSEEQRKKAFRAVLLHVFQDVHAAENRDLMLRSVARENLLIPPLMTNRLGWKHGIFKNFARIENVCEQMLEVYCFRSGSRFYDENGLRSVHSIPCGSLGLHSYLSVEDEILQALERTQ